MIPIYLQLASVCSVQASQCSASPITAELGANSDIPHYVVWEGFRSLQSFRPKFPEKSAPNKKTESERQLWLLVALA